MRLNKDGTHETSHYNLGRGILYAARLDGNDDPNQNIYDGGWADLGNCTDMNLTIDIEELDHTSKREEISLTDVNIITSRTIKLSFTLDSITGFNVAKFINAQAVLQIPNLINLGPQVISIDIKDPDTYGGRWYDLVVSPGLFLRDTGAITIAGKSEPGDFIADTMDSRIFIPEGSTITPGATNVNIAQNASAEDIMALYSFTDDFPKYGLKFISTNPNETDSNYKGATWNFFKVDLRPTDNVVLVSDEWTSIPFEGVLEESSASGPYATELSRLMQVVSYPES